MLVIGGLIIGAILGAWQAKRRGGNGTDMAQYAFVHALVLGVVGLGLTIALDRMLLQG